MSTPLSILVVEDETESASLLVEVLIEAGHGVVGPVGSAAHASALVGQACPDIALIDIGLNGDSDGVELARSLKANWGVRAIFVTGRSEVSAADAEAALFVLRKPYGEGALPEAVRRGSDLLQLG